MLFDPTEREEMARQQQQQAQPPRPPIGIAAGDGGNVHIEAVLCIPPDQLRYLPKRAKLPASLPINALPGMGEAYYPVNDGSVWAVELKQHRWLTPTHLRIEVWIVNVDHTYPRHRRPPGFEMTQ